jgi:hypothetical protein
MGIGRYGVWERPGEEHKVWDGHGGRGTEDSEKVGSHLGVRILPGM